MPGVRGDSAQRGRSSDTVRPNKVLFIRNIPKDFDQARCEREFGLFAGFESFRMLAKGKGSGFLTYSSIETATAAKNEFAKSILKVTFKGSTTCDKCDSEVTKWMNCICKGRTYCSPRCLMDHNKAGHATDCVDAPSECKCVLGGRFPGAFRCVCQRISWCRMQCMEDGLAAHETSCAPRRFVPPAVQRRYRQQREHENVSKLRNNVQDLKKKMDDMNKAHEKQMQKLKTELQKLKVTGRPQSAAPPSAPPVSEASAPIVVDNSSVILSAELLPKAKANHEAPQEEKEESAA